MPHARRALLALLVLLLPLPATAQTAASVVEAMKARYEAQLATVDDYVIVTDLYTTYHRKITQNGQSTYETATRMTGASDQLSALGTAPTSTVMDATYLDRLAQHATYAGTETLNGATCHVLQIDDPSALHDDVDATAQDMRYYVDAQTDVPVRIHMTMAPSSSGNGPSTFTIDFADYRTVKGLTLPYQMVMQMDLGLSAEQQKQMEQLQRQLEQMPERQRKQMERMMGDRFKQLEQMMAGKPTTIAVQSVQVNEGIPEGVFDSDGA